MVQIDNLHREFKVLKRKSGLKGSFQNLFSREYNIVNAVKNLSIHIDRGEIVGFLGTNGAGKSTTIKMMIGVLKQTNGTIKINGMNPYEDHIRFSKDIGVVFGQRTQLWWALPVRESFHILKQIYEVSNQDFNENMRLFEEIVGCEELLDKPARELSLGQRTLCDILIAFLHNPSIVFLDEPTIGLDVSMKNKIHLLIKELNRRKNTTVVLTTHDMGDVDALCNRVIIMNKGDCIYDDSINKLVRYFGDYKTIHLKYDHINIKETCKVISEYFINYKNIKIKQNVNEIELLVNEKEAAVLHILNELQKIVNVQDISITELSTEEIVRKIYEGGINDVE